MLFSDNTRHLYTKPQLVETFCQLVFPPIKSLNEDAAPAEFQDAIKADFPQYMVRKEQQPPRMINGKMTQLPTISNHTFVSQDNFWKVNLTPAFITLSTVRYTRWEDFAARLDKVIASFIEVYKPANFQRIGLRYMNAFSKEHLGFQADDLWDDLINAPFIGILSEPDVDEKKTARCSLDVELGLADDCRLRLHSGPGMLNFGKNKPELRFMLDGDFCVIQKEIPGDVIAEKLNILHDHATRLLNAAITEDLRNAMGPIPMDAQ